MESVNESGEIRQLEERMGEKRKDPGILDIKWLSIHHRPNVRLTAVLILVFGAAFFICPLKAGAEEGAQDDQLMTMEEVTVTSERIILPTRQTDETVYTGTEITSKGMEAQGAKAKTSVYESMVALP
jgi:iron complex outermembrane receptor protein